MNALSCRRAAAVIAVAALSALSACSGASSGGSSGADDAIDVGLIPPTTGALAQFGTDTVAAWKFAADEVNRVGGVDGRKMRIHVYETDGTPAKTLDAARKAVTQDGVDFLGAVMTGPENMALNAQLATLGALNFNGTANDDELIGHNCTANAFRAVPSSSMDLAALTAQVAQLPRKKWAVLAVDYSIGHSAADTFTHAVEDAGGKVVSTQFAPLGTTDFGTYISQLKAAGADGLFAVEYGADAVAFVQQGHQFRLFDGFGSVVGMNMVSEPLFDAIGKGSVGFLANVDYDVTSDQPLNEKFVRDWTATHDAPPYYVEANTYLAAQMLIHGVRAAGSSDPDAVRDALAGLSFDSIAGHVTVRGADHQLLLPTYVGRLSDRAGKLGWDILDRAAPASTTPDASSECAL